MKESVQLIKAVTRNLLRGGGVFSLFPFPRFEVALQIQLMDLCERCKLPSAGKNDNGCKCIFVAQVTCLVTLVAANVVLFLLNEI